MDTAFYDGIVNDVACFSVFSTSKLQSNNS